MTKARRQEIRARVGAELSRRAETAASKRVRQLEAVEAGSPASRELGELRKELAAVEARRDKRDGKPMTTQQIDEICWRIIALRRAIEALVCGGVAA